MIFTVFPTVRRALPGFHCRNLFPGRFPFCGKYGKRKAKQQCKTHQNQRYKLLHETSRLKKEG